MGAVGAVGHHLQRLPPETPQFTLTRWIHLRTPIREKTAPKLHHAPKMAQQRRKWGVQLWVHFWIVKGG